MSPPVSAVQAAYREGYAAGQSRAPAMPNPYAGEPLQPWELARMSDDEQRQARREQHDRRILATTWRQARQKGIDAHAQRRSPGQSA